VNGKKQTQFQFRSTAEAFETERLLSDVEATKFMYEKGYLNLHAGDSMSAYGTKAIKVAEFSEAFGAKGEIINLALQRVRQSFADAMKDNPNNANFLRSTYGGSRRADYKFNGGVLGKVWKNKRFC
jgi:hypothetical protein